MLTKEPEMLQPDAFCEHTMQLNATVAGAPPRTLYSAPPDLVARGRGKGGKGKGGKGKKREARGGREKKGGEGRLTLMYSWYRAAEWLRPALYQSTLKLPISIYRKHAKLIRRRYNTHLRERRRHFSCISQSYLYYAVRRVTEDQLDDNSNHHYGDVRLRPSVVALQRVES